METDSPPGIRFSHSDLCSENLVAKTFFFYSLLIFMFINFIIFSVEMLLKSFE